MGVLPPLPYFGSKVRLSATMASYLPEHTHYVEGFCGGLSLLFAKPPSPVETINDLDNNVITFWRMLRDRPDDLIRACAYSPYAREEFYDARDPAVQTDDLERARRTFIRLTQGRMAKPRNGATWRHPLGNERSPAEEMSQSIARLEAAAARLRNVYIEHMDAVQLLTKYGRSEEVMFYLDPPYVHSARPDTKNYYVHEMSDSEHIQLAEAAHNAKGPVVISGYDSSLYQQLYADWYTVVLPMWTTQGNGTRQPRIEVMWLNREPRGQQTLFDNFEEAS